MRSGGESGDVGIDGMGVDVVGLVGGGSRHWRFVCVGSLACLVVSEVVDVDADVGGGVGGWEEEGGRGSTYGGCRISLQLLERKATAICEAVQPHVSLSYY